MLCFSIQNASPRWYESGLRSGGCEITSLSSDIFGYRLYFGGNNPGMPRGNLTLRISWQAQYLVQLEGDSCCSAHSK